MRVGGFDPRAGKGVDVLIANLFMGLTTLAWGLLGLMMTIVPAMGLACVKGVFLDPWRRFWMGQAIMLMGLILMIGTVGLKGFWVWVACGGLAVAKACILLGATASGRDRILRRINHWPVWLYRCSGMIHLALAVGLAADLILYG